MSLALYVARRLVVLVPTLFFVSVLIFSLQQLLPGDAALALAGEERDEAAVAAIRAKYHLDRPVVAQYTIWMGKVLRGDLGESLRNRLPVTELLASKLPVTLELAAASMLIALAIGIPAGVLSAARRGTVTDLTANLVALSGLSVPHFWLGIMLILLFAIPGFGKLLVDGVFSRACAVVQGGVLVSATLYVLLNLVADVLYFVANPRLRGG